MIETILITAGGTSEPIDNVRHITNTGTGRLGSLVADTFAHNSCIRRIFYVCSSNAIRPQSERIIMVEIQTVSDLQSAVTRILSEHRVDAVIHSMAVSDYAVRAVSTLGDLANCLEREYAVSLDWESSILEAMDHTDIRMRTGKLSSQMDSPLILLDRTPKILPLFRELAPDATIVGFKLLSETPKAELLKVAFQLLQKNGCDFVLANDTSQISGDQHIGHLIDREENVITFHTKQEIADGIVSIILRETDQQL